MDGTVEECLTSLQRGLLSGGPRPRYLASVAAGKNTEVNKRLSVSEVKSDMVYCILREQLGNQLFIWAAGYSLARDWGCPLYLITSNYGRTGTYMYLRVFPVGAKFLSPWPGLICRRLLRRELYSLQSFTHVVGNWNESSEGAFENSHFAKLRSAPVKPTLLDDLFQSWHYFGHHRESIRRELSVTTSTMTRHADAETLKRIRDTESVSVHIRRTDYLADHNTKFAVCGPQYFSRCLDLLRDVLKRPVFYVFSDDISWARSEFSAPDINFVSSVQFRSSNINDFVLMANCRSHVISNSTFSWWAAYAGDSSGHTLMPSRWFNDGSAPIEHKMVDGWTPVSVD